MFMEKYTANPEEFYKSLKKNLDLNHDFPCNYLYKFILTNHNEEKLGELYQVFDNLEYSLTTKESSNGKYLSVTISCFVLDSDHVIKIYKDVSKIESIIML